MITSHLPAITVEELTRTISQQVGLFLPYMEQLRSLESHAEPEHLERLAAHTHPLVNQAALALLAQKQLPPDLDPHIRLGIFVRLIHNLERLAELPPQKLLYLAFLDENNVPQPCPDPLEFVLLRAHTDTYFPFLSPS